MAAKVELELNVKTGQAVQEAKNFSSSMTQVEQGAEKANKGTINFGRGSGKALTILGGPAAKLAYRFGALAFVAYELKAAIDTVAASNTKALDTFEGLDKSSRELAGRLGYTEGESDALRNQLTELAKTSKVSSDEIFSIADSVAEMATVSVDEMKDATAAFLTLEAAIGKKKTHKLLAELGEEAEKAGQKLTMEDVVSRIGATLEEAGLTPEEALRRESVARGGVAGLHARDIAGRQLGAIGRMSTAEARGRARLLKNIEEDPSALPFATTLERTGALLYPGSSLGAMELAAENSSRTVTNRILAQRNTGNTTRASNLTSRSAQTEAAVSLKR